MERGELAMSESPNLPKAQVSERPGSSDSSEYDVNESSQPLSTRTHRQVKRSLRPIHIFLITVSGTIGMGLFDNSGEILRIAGPAGGIMAYIVVGVCVVCVMEGVAEMIGHWPIANCMVEFIAKFVDKDLAIVMGIAYWYSFAISFATLVVAASNLASFWQWSMTLQDLMFTVGIPCVLVFLNCMGVLWYAYVESLLGVMKITLVLGSFLTMIIINNLDTHADTPNGKIQSSNIDDGFQHDPTVASSPGIAVLVAIPIVAYAYIGVEIVAVTALEAKHPQRSLKFPAKWIAWLTFGTYLFSAIGFYLNASWTDSDLPVMEGRKNVTMVSTAQNMTIQTPSNSTTVQSTAIVVIATLRAHIPTLPSFINVGLICAVLSTSNTSLYVASRTLFGLTRGVDPKDKIWGWLSRLSVTSPGNKIPAAALAFSALAFCWVPFLRLSKSYSDQELQEIMSGIATVAVVLVWAALCLAFIRYRAWLKMHERELFKEGYREYNHWSISTEDVPYKFRTLLCWAQPIPAYIGLISCLLIVFVFATASWWNGGEKSDAVLSAMAGPIILFGIWLVMKYTKHRNGDFEWYVKLGTWDDLSRTLDELGRARRDDDDDMTQRSTRGRQESGVQSLRLQQYPNFPSQLRDSFERPREDSAYSNVSPTAGLDRRPLAEQEIDVTDQARNQSQSRSPRASGQTSLPDIYGVSISGAVPRRKPVSGTASGLGLSPRNSGQSMGSQDLMLPINFDETSRHPSLGSLTYGEYLGSLGPSSTPRRSSQNELIPPDRQEIAGARFTKSQRSDLDLEIQGQDLQNQGARRQEIWEQQRQAYDPALPPQSPPRLAPPQWNPNYVGRAVSEPDTGVQGTSQTLHRQRGMNELRERGGWGGYGG